MAWKDNGALNEHNNPGSEIHTNFLKKFVEFGEVIYIEFDPKNESAKLLTLEEFRKKNKDE